MKYHQIPSYFLKPPPAGEDSPVTHRLVVAGGAVTHAVLPQVEPDSSNGQDGSKTCLETNQTTKKAKIDKNSETIKKASQKPLSGNIREMNKITEVRKETTEKRLEEREVRAQTQVTLEDTKPPSIFKDKLVGRRTPSLSPRSSKSPSPIEELFWRATAVTTRYPQS